MERIETLVVLSDDAEIVSAYQDVGCGYRTVVCNKTDFPAAVPVQENMAFLLDMRFLLVDGFQAIPAIKSAFGSVPVIVLYKELVDSLLVAAIKSGADDVFLFDTRWSVIERRIRSFPAGTAVPAVVAENRAETVPPAIPTVHSAVNGKLRFAASPVPGVPAVPFPYGERRSAKTELLLSEPAQRFSSVKSKIADAVIGNSPQMHNLREEIEMYATEEDPVLLVGESGTGKSSFARLLHTCSLRSQYKIGMQNSAALTQNLASADLFGVAPGAYTDARCRIGLLESCNGGSLLFDEIGEMEMAVQARILTLFDEKIIYKLGSTKPFSFDVRFLFATNADLEKRVERREFRRDLYYRIDTFIIRIPPLREHRGDIPALAERFLKKGCRLTPAAVDKLLNYDWPGNVRELQNCLKAAAVKAKKRLFTDLTITADAIQF